MKDTKSLNKRRQQVSFDAYYFEQAHQQCDMQKTFQHIHDINLWGASETKSGEGSTQAETHMFAKELCYLIDALSVKRLLDAPCGDFNWLSQEKLNIDTYIGVDILTDQIQSLTQAYQANDQYEFMLADLTKDPLPNADLILCRDCLVHFSFEDIKKAILNFKKSGSTYLLTTHFPSTKTNDNIVTGDWQPLNLEAAPFFFPNPLKIINEGCAQSDGLYQDKSLALWSLADL